MLGIFLNPDGSAVNKAEKNPCFLGTYLPVGKTDKKETCLYIVLGDDKGAQGMGTGFENLFIYLFVGLFGFENLFIYLLCFCVLVFSSRLGDYLAITVTTWDQRCF